MSFKPTEQQEEIYRIIGETENHVMINAGAGAGKTTTIVQASKLVEDKKCAFLCFNKSIQTELAERLPSHVEAKTFHSFGFAALRNAGIKTKMNNFKVANIIKDILGKDFHYAGLKKLVGLMKGSLISEFDRQGIYSLIDEYDIQFYDDRQEEIALNAIPRIMEECRSQTHIIDFDDMIWLPIVLNLTIPKYDILFVDEAQDFNEAQRELIDRAVNGGRCIIVGDPNQAIYGFRGADSNSMNMFKQRLQEKNTREVSELPLSVSFRCPKNVVAEANRYVKDFHALENAEDGKVVEFATISTAVKGDIILCRYNAPLVSAFYSMIGEGISAYILGRDMSKGLVNSVKKISKDNSMSSTEFWGLYQQQHDYDVQKALDQDRKQKAIALEDKRDCIAIFVSKADTVGGIIAEIEKVFDGNGKGDIMLSTVHKAKGLEADNVYVLATERMPHPKGGIEENNIIYVAITRAKKNLFYCGGKPTKN